MMVIRKELAYLLLIFGAFYVGCESLSTVDVNDDYPVFIKRLEMNELRVLNDVYHQMNKGLICSTLNEYGLTGFSRVLFPNDINPCLNREIEKQELIYDDDFLNLVKLKLFENAAFTGTREIESLTLADITSLDGCTICEGPDINNVPLQWKFTFEPQQVNGIIVSGTEVVVYLDSNGINRIWGNWYPVVDPGFIEFGSSEAKKSVVGMKVRYANETNQIFEQEITEDHIFEAPELMYVAVNVDAGLEIHKVWILKVLQHNTSQIRWNIFFSTITGEVLEVKLL